MTGWTFGNQALGKPLGNDVANRKPTLPVMRLLETTSPADRPSLLAMLNGGMSDTLRELLDKSDASAVTLDTARRVRPFGLRSTPHST